MPTLDHQRAIRARYKDDRSKYGISIVKIRQSWDRLFFITGIPILVRRHICIGIGPRCSGTQQYRLITENTTDNKVGLYFYKAVLHVSIFFIICFRVIRRQMFVKISQVLVTKFDDMAGAISNYYCTVKPYLWRHCTPIFVEVISTKKQLNIVIVCIHESVSITWFDLKDLQEMTASKTLDFHVNNTEMVNIS